MLFGRKSEVEFGRVIDEGLGGNRVRENEAGEMN